ncbi:hypothetical protein ABZ407_41050, partial [Streptomyces tibetensis]
QDQTKAARASGEPPGERLSTRHRSRPEDKKQAKGGRPTGFDKTVYKRRNEVERTINALKIFRAVATRFDKRWSEPDRPPSSCPDPGRQCPERHRAPPGHR